MPVESKITCATSVENQNRIEELNKIFNSSTSKTVHNLLTTILSLNPDVIWQLQGAKQLLGYDILDEINKVVLHRGEQLKTK